MKKMKLLLLALLGTATSLLAEGIYPQITNIDNRRTTPLNGNWHYIIDQLETGYYDYRRKPTEFGFFLDEKQENPKLIEYNFDTSPTLYVPRDWNSQAPELLYYEGCIWYRTKFDHKPTSGKRLFLHFGAINYQSIVYLNGKKLGQHIGGYTPFNFEITSLVKDGENSLVVMVDNKRQKEAVPTDNFDWWNYGGITRPVTLIETPSTFIRDYFIQLTKGNAGEISGWVQLDGDKPQSEITVEIPELKKSIKLTPDSKGYAKFTIKAKPQLWTPENPKLYKVTLSGAGETLNDEIGFRTIETSGSKILLNGKPVFCRGISIHEEAPLRKGGRAYGKDDARTLLGWAKEMGCNFVRLAHYPHNEQMIKEAERMGLMVWSEIPVYWTIDWTNPDVLANAKNQLEENITRDKNRCNIIIWSVANETPVSAPRLEFLKSLVERTRQLDNTRLVGAAMEKEEIRPGILTVHDPLGQYLDLLSFNQYVGWYDGLPEKCDRVNWEFPSDKPVVITEWGGGALAGMHGDKSERWTEEFQEEVYKANIRMLKRIKGLAGTTPWILMDFRSPKRPLTGIQDGFNRKGVISDYGQKKKAFYIMQEWYKELEEEYK
ncbi:MAG: glycoside hydrolase family 2 TIM barrel-domain containing protein [Bacteroidales bacterium]|nr:glycoside hydrolase family 2 TIM barrel-domain containing protein [Bacteroidales bacterium]